MRVEVISPHGFCGGVRRAVEIAHRTLDAMRADADGRGVFCLHEIVHNGDVVRELAGKGMRFVESVCEVPDGATLLVSAHGTAPATIAEASARRIRVVDATCPFVAEAHAKIRANHSEGMRTVIVGSPSHAEVVGYLGEPGACLPEDVRPGEKVGKVVQTTLDAGSYDGVCTATRDRQQAVAAFVAAHGGEVTGVVVVGGAKSANSVRLVEIATRAGAKAWLVQSAEDALRLDVGGMDALGVTSGASTPEHSFLRVVGALESKVGAVCEAHSERRAKQGG